MNHETTADHRVDANKMVPKTTRVEGAIDRQYATGMAPKCLYCGDKVPKAEVVWGATAGAWHGRCAPVIQFADGTSMKVTG